MEAHDPATVFSSIDHSGRYAYGNQPAIVSWNLARLAEALLPLLHEDEGEAVELATASLQRFPEQFLAAMGDGMRAKLGLRSEDPQLAEDLLGLMRGADHTRFFRHLATAARGDAEPARGLVLDLAAFDAWLDRWRALGPDADAMDRVNPVYVPRNRLVEQALQAGTDGDLAPLGTLLSAIQQPYDERPGLEDHALPGPDDGVRYRTFCGT
jgi:uncharacterized protein YdiU (UPF0061 family)